MAEVYFSCPAWLFFVCLFLYFLTSVIKCILWNSGKAKEGKVFLQTRVRQKTWSSLPPGKPHRVLLSYSFAPTVSIWGFVRRLLKTAGIYSACSKKTWEATWDLHPTRDSLGPITATEGGRGIKTPAFLLLTWMTLQEKYKKKCLRMINSKFRVRAIGYAS